MSGGATTGCGTRPSPAGRGFAGGFAATCAAGWLYTLAVAGAAGAAWAGAAAVPGPLIRVLQGDTVELTLRNPAQVQVTHSINLHAVTGPGGGSDVTQIPPGGQAAFSFKALHPGVYVYHCMTPIIPHHVAQGMYGLIVVEPPGGFPKVDHEEPFHVATPFAGEPSAVVKVPPATSTARPGPVPSSSKTVSAVTGPSIPPPRADHANPSQAAM